MVGRLLGHGRWSWSRQVSAWWQATVRSPGRATGRGATRHVVGRRTGSGPRTRSRSRTAARSAVGPQRRRREVAGVPATLGADAASSAVYGCAGWCSTSLDRALLDQVAAVEHGDPVGDAGQRTEVVRDDHDRRGRSRPQLVEQPQHVVAVRHVERADRLVGEQQPRPGHDRPGQQHPLPLAAGELRRVRRPRSPASSPTASSASRDPRADVGAARLPGDAQRLGDDRRRRSAGGRAPAAGPGRSAAPRRCAGSRAAAGRAARSGRRRRTRSGPA